MALDPEHYTFMGKMEAHMDNQTSSMTEMKASVEKIHRRIDEHKENTTKQIGDIKTEQSAMKTKLGILAGVFVAIGHWVVGLFKGE